MYKIIVTLESRKEIAARHRIFEAVVALLRVINAALSVVGSPRINELLGEPRVLMRQFDEDDC